MKLLLVALLLALSYAAPADDSTAGASQTADNAMPQALTPEGESDLAEMGKGSEGAGRLVDPTKDQKKADIGKLAAAGNATMAQEDEEQKKMVCLCKKTNKVPAEADDKTLAAGWRKRAKKCDAQGDEDPESDKCVVVKKAARCETKEDRKNNAQCKAKPKTKKQKEAETAAKQNAKEKRQADEADGKADRKARCLSKYCADEDNLNRSNKGTVATGVQCYDKCNKAHCTKLFDAGWEHWYECVQTCIGNCYSFED